jgi:hypothetical protein
LIPELLHELRTRAVGLEEVQAGWTGREVLIQFLVIIGIQTPINIFVKKIHTLPAIEEVAHCFPSK